MENLDFEIEIDLASGRDYPVTVVHSPAGEGRGTLHFPYDELALDNHLTKLQLALLNSGRGQRRVVPAEERTVREFGTALFDALFAGEVRTLLDVSRHEARSKGTGLRVKLRCRAPELAALPWEFLFDTEVDEYLCLSRQTPLVRYLEVSTPCEPLKVALPLRILGVVASPKDLDSLDVDREKQRVEQAVAHLVESGKVELEWLAKPTWRELQLELSRRRWHVVHFVGHGGFDQRRDEGVLAFEDDDGNAHLLGAGDVGLLLGDHDDLRLAVLNACEGARSSTRDVFSSTAAVLVRKGTPGVVAMQYAITDLAAIELARSFYDCVAAGQPVDTAMSEARKAVRLSLPGTLEWGTPVLFMRAPDGVLFDLDGAAPAVPVARPRQVAPKSPKRSEGSAPRRLPSRKALIGSGAAAAVVAAIVLTVVLVGGGGSGGVGTGPAKLRAPRGIALAPEGTVFVSDSGHHRVVSVSPAGKVSTVAGSGANEDSGDGGPALQAGIRDPATLAVGPDGALYIADQQGSTTIRKVVNGRIETLRPESGSDFFATAMTVGPKGNLLAAEWKRVWAIPPKGAAFPIAGTGTGGFTGEGDIATNARVNNVLGIAVGPDQTSFYIADADNRVVRKIGADSRITTVAGNRTSDFGQDGDKATEVGLAYPTDIGFDAGGNLYIYSQDRAVYRVTPEGRIFTVIKSNEPGFDGDGGPVVGAKFSKDTIDMAVSPNGDLYILDQDNNRVRKVHDGVVSTVA